MGASFKQIGNLSFYDGWSPKYVYFKSLLSRANTWTDTHNSWDTNAAREKASIAVSDALSHMNPYNMSDAESLDYFLKKFNRIIEFLEKAIKYEQANENAYIKQLIRGIKRSFSPEEQKKITALQHLQQRLEDGLISNDIKYDEINAQINVLLQGFDGTKALLDYEGKRVQQIDTILKKIVQSRYNQAAGLGKSQKKSLEEQLDMGQRAAEKLQKKIYAEYVKTQQLTRRGQDNKYVLFGVDAIKSEVAPAIDRVLAKWTEDMLDKLSSDKRFINSIAEQIENQYPPDGNFNWLEDKVQEEIIQSIIKIGANDLSSVLNNEISKNLIRSVKRKILLNNNWENILDNDYQYEINGLKETFGRYVTQPEMVKDAHTLAEIESKTAKETYNAIKRLLVAQKDFINHKQNTTNSYLIQAMKKSTSDINGNNTLERAQDMISLIEELEGLEKQLEKAKKEWRKKMKQIKDKNFELTKEIQLDNKSELTFTITVRNGVVKIDQNSFLKVLREDNRYKNFGFKTFNPESLKTTITTLKKRASIDLQHDIISALQKANFEIPEEDLVRHVANELKNVKIKIDGPTLAELLTGVYFTGTKEKMMFAWNRYTGTNVGKNDSVAIVIQHGKFTRKFQSSTFYQLLYNNGPIIEAEQMIEKAQKKIAYEYQKTVDEAITSMTRAGDEHKYSKMIDVMNIDIMREQQQNQELEEAYQELEKNVELLKSMAKRHNIEGLTNEDIDKMGEEYLNFLQNAFYISTTVKSRNDYVNNIGITGGDLGSSLDKQLSRIDDIFNSAGMPISQKDMEWIKSAIINCFPGSVAGEKNKGLIENYLGALMGFALFDEGSVESDIISAYYEQIFKSVKFGTPSSGNRNILHLYVINGLYIKGSTILQRTLDTLKEEVIPNIEQIPVTMHRGAGITIINPAQESRSIVPNRPYKEYLDNPNPAAWRIVGERVSKNTKIQVLFLAGLLDIINSINNALNSTELIQ